MTDMERIKSDHGMAQAHVETVRLAQAKHLVGTVSYSQGHRTGWWDAIRWLLASQEEWDSLTAGAALEELRKGDGSIYWPVFADDKCIWVDCPGCEKPTLIDAQGLCPECAHDFEGEQA